MRSLSRAGRARMGHHPCMGHVRHLYVHVPFCAHRCGYCDFVTVTGHDERHGPYVDAILTELAGRGDVLGEVETVYIGGGTPSRLGPELLGRLLDALPQAAGETTVECNPEGVDEALADSHTDKGPSRLNLPADMIHEYGPAYARHIGPLRDRELRVLEIGIGCTPWMPVEGGSLAFWRSYVPCVHLTWVDFDGGCVERIGSRADAAFQADQSVPADLLRVYSQGGPFDVIVDDGGHTMKQQITTLRTLFPKLPPAGIFVLEDLLTSFVPPSMGGHDMVPQANTTGARFVSDVISHMHMKSNKPFFVRPETLEGSAEIARLALAVDCYREICVFVRNGLPA